MSLSTISSDLAYYLHGFLVLEDHFSDRSRGKRKLKYNRAERHCSKCTDEALNGPLAHITSDIRVRRDTDAPDTLNREPEESAENGNEDKKDA